MSAGNGHGHESLPVEGSFASNRNPFTHLAQHVMVSHPEDIAIAQTFATLAVADAIERLADVWSLIVMAEHGPAQGGP